jgi:hypothetical protein
MIRIAIRFFFAVFLFLTTASTSLWAQATAQISGTVKDPSGAVLPGVEITATQTGTGVARNTVSNETGSYVLANLALGPYRLEVSLPGFRTYVQNGIVLEVNSSPVVNVTLEVGQITESVEVQANAALVETRSVGVGNVIENQRILELPLNGRQVTDLITLAGGAVQTGAATLRSGVPGTVTISVAGSQSFGVNYIHDGITNYNPSEGTTFPYPFPDAMQEFKVETSALSAQNGMHSGATVSGVTKSGTNEIHGTLFEFVRNGKFNARNFFAAKRDTLKRNQFGGTLGGPIIKNKLFFFGGYQGTTTRSDPNETLAFVPTAQMLTGDFTTYASPACNNGRQITLRAPFVNNRVDPALFSPAALNVTGRLPKSNDPCGRLVFGPIQKPNEWQGVGRVDYQLNGKQSIFGRYIGTGYARLGGLHYNPENVLTATTAGFNSLVQSVVLGHTYLINSNMVNSFRVAGTRWRNERPVDKYFDAVDVGVKNFYNGYLPGLMTVQQGGFQLGSTSPSKTANHTFQFVDDLSLTRGNHQMSFGGTYSTWVAKTDISLFGLGDFRFTGEFTGLGLSDFLTGKLSRLTQGGVNLAYLDQKYFGLYGQDTWKASQRLTVNYGVRWEPFLPPEVSNGRTYRFDYSAFLAGKRTSNPAYYNAPAGLFYPGDPGFPGKAGMNKQWKTIAPRLGAGWDVSGDGRTAIRAGYGFAFDFPAAGHTLTYQPIAGPWVGRVAVFAPSGGFDNPFSDYPGGNPFPGNVDKGGLYFQYAPYANLGNYDTKTPTVHSWNLSLEKQLGTNLFLSTAYLGSHTVHLWVLRDENPGVFLGLGPCTINGVAYTTCTTAGNLDQRRRLNLAKQPDGGFFGSIGGMEDGGTASYNALRVSIRRRAARGVTVDGNYTLSHCIGDTFQSPGNPGEGYVDNANRYLDRGNCVSDRRHIVNISTVVETPQFGNNVLRTVASSWRVSGIYRWSTGAYLTILSGQDRAFTGMISQRPDLVNPNPYNNRDSLTNYFNVSAFALPAPGMNGTMGRNNVVGPNTWGLDMALSRTFQVLEGQRLEFRAEAFNLTNSLRKGNPGLTLNTNTFGQITTASDPRIMQFALKYVF